VAAAFDVLGGVAIGAVAWYGGFALAVTLARRRIGPRLLAPIDVLIGSALVMFGVLVGHQALREQPE
jgi:hypothetical protein